MAVVSTVVVPFFRVINWKEKQTCIYSAELNSENVCINTRFCCGKVPMTHFSDMFFIFGSAGFRWGETLYQQTKVYVPDKVLLFLAN